MDCGDNSCLFVKGDERHGMRTNGGCRCLSDLPREKQRELRQFIFELRARLAAAEARVAELEGLLRASLVTSEGCEEGDAGEEPCGFCFDCQVRAALRGEEVQGE